MAYKYPYTLSSTHLIQMIGQLRKSFPQAITADTIKKLGIAPNSESYLINTLKFIGVIDNEGNKSKGVVTVFSKHDDAEFAQEFGKLVHSSYSELFDLNGDEAWTLEQSKLITFFRGADESGENVGHRQAYTFQTLAFLSGHGEKPASGKTQTAKVPSSKKGGKPSAVARTKKGKPVISVDESGQGAPADVERKVRELGLTVRIEINLPAVADQKTYDMIFKSIRENLIDVE